MLLVFWCLYVRWAGELDPARVFHVLIARCKRPRINSQTRRVLRELETYDAYHVLMTHVF